MSRHLFGKRGDAPTEYETALLARCDNLDDRWVAVGKRIGAEALFIVLDEIGDGALVSAPSREMFVKRLYLPVRDAEILQLHQQDVDVGFIANTYRLTPKAVREAIARALKAGFGGKC